ncbi:hypothetical protein KIPB_013451 [Kipferlia bialata]|uniref:Uncharacterized protein n=1 Tax=Kipferlia bialata TaxID=797122 RepID=A0A9K3GQ56_9EUKA|nr:hypothetical protein KIPB_013451 [Kipferlia bialata]|eukprot:g13451.t1
MILFSNTVRNSLAVSGQCRVYFRLKYLSDTPLVLCVSPLRMAPSSQGTSYPSLHLCMVPDFNNFSRPSTNMMQPAVQHVSLDMTQVKVR